MSIEPIVTGARGRLGGGGGGDGGDLADLGIACWPNDRPTMPATPTRQSPTARAATSRSKHRIPLPCAGSLAADRNSEDDPACFTRGSKALPIRRQAASHYPGGRPQHRGPAGPVGGRREVGILRDLRKGSSRTHPRSELRTTLDRCVTIGQDMFRKRGDDRPAQMGGPTVARATLAEATRGVAAEVWSQLRSWVSVKSWNRIFLGISPVDENRLIEEFAEVVGPDASRSCACPRAGTRSARRRGAGPSGG